MAKKSVLQTIEFETAKAFESWLAKNHDSVTGIWLKIYKKESGKKTVTYSEALDAALCYGWIDGQKQAFDENAWLQKFTPRGPRSIWSKKNTENVERLIKEKRMKPAGLKAVEKARADGNWQQAYDAGSKTTIPDDFLKEIGKNKKAKAFFETLNKTNLFSIAFRLQTAKKPETREKRMKQIIEMLEKGEKFH